MKKLSTEKLSTRKLDILIIVASLFLIPCNSFAQLAVASGGTGNTTAQSAKSAAGLNIESGTGHGDSNYTIQPTDHFVYTTAAFTFSRVWTLPAANAVNAGATIVVADLFGGLGPYYLLINTAGGGDTVNGTTGVFLQAAYGSLILTSDGASQWYAQIGYSATERPDHDYGRLTFQVDKSNTTLSPFGAMFMQAGYSYTVHLTLHQNLDAVGGAQYAFSASGGLTLSSMIVHATVADDATGSVRSIGRITALGTAITDSTGSTSATTTLEGTFVPSHDGYLYVLFAQHAASGTSSILANSSSEVFRIGY